MDDTALNYAELQRRIDLAPTLDDCKRLGSTHAAYGWYPRPPHNASPEGVAAYNHAFDDQLERELSDGDSNG